MFKIPFGMDLPAWERGPAPSLLHLRAAGRDWLTGEVAAAADMSPVAGNQSPAVDSRRIPAAVADSYSSSHRHWSPAAADTPIAVADTPDHTLSDSCSHPPKASDRASHRSGTPCWADPASEYWLRSRRA